MQRTRRWASPLGEILLAADDEGLTGLWSEGQRRFARGLAPDREESSSPILDDAVRWLEAYFAGRDPGPPPPLHMTGTAFQLEVWRMLLEIPWGTTTTYGELARKIAARRSAGRRRLHAPPPTLGHPARRGRMSARAVGGAVGRNSISIIVPCHRVVGSNGSLTGYAGGIERKRALLILEGAIAR